MAVKARIAVLGAGLMGHGIAQVFGLAGHEVSIYDPVAANLDQVRARIAGTEPPLRLWCLPRRKTGVIGT